MAKQIRFEYKGTEYILEYNRDTIMTLEARGFSAQELEKKVVTSITILFEGAFIMHHPTVKRDVINEIFECLGNKEDLWGKLTEMYADTVSTLFDEPKEKNITWAVNW